MTMTTTTKSAKKISPNRGAKILIGTLSVAATLSGWAWLTLTNNAEAEAVTEPALITDEIVAPGVPVVPTALPALKDLPVRGLRVVGAATRAAPAQTQGQVQAPFPQPNTANGQGVQAAPQPQAPAPRPQPVRKTQSSR